MAEDIHEPVKDGTLVTGDVSLGRIVHYVDDVNREVWPAIVVRVFPSPMSSAVNLHVFKDGHAPDRVVTSVRFSSVPARNTWHWPERI